MKNRKLMAGLGIVLVAMLVFGSVGVAVAKPKPKPKPNLVARAVNQAKYYATGSLVRNLASLADTSTAAVTAKRAEGSSLTSIAVDFGVEPAAVVTMTLAKFKARLNVLVRKKHVTRKNAAKVYAIQEARLWRLMNRVPPCVTPPPVVPPTTCPDPCVPIGQALGKP